MKRKLFTGLLLLFLAIFGVFAYFEIRYAEFEVNPEELTTKVVQEKCPEVILTGRDKTFASAALDLSQVQEVRQNASTEEMSVSGAAVDALILEYYPELEGALLTVTGKSVMLEGKLDADTKIYLQFSNVIYLRKLSAHYRSQGDEQVVKTMYENLNGETYQQYIQRKVWFSYWKD